MRNQLPRFERELEVLRRLLAPTLKSHEFWWLIKGVLNFNAEEGARVFGS